MNRRQFYADQIVTPTDLNQIQGDAEDAISNMIINTMGKGLVSGGAVVFEDATTPAAVEVGALYGITNLGQVVKFSTTIPLALTNTGYTEVGEGGTPDGAPLTLADGEEVYATVLVYSARLEEDLRQTNPPVYFANLESYKFRVVAGAIAESEAGEITAVRPALPAGNDYLVLGDCLVKNTGTGAFVDRVDTGRRSVWIPPFQAASGLDVGFPILCRRIVRALGADDPNYNDNLNDDDQLYQSTASDPDGDPNFWGAVGQVNGLGGFFQPEFFGFLLWTMAGAFSWEEQLASVPTNSRNQFYFTACFRNVGTTPISRTMKVHLRAGMRFDYNFFAGGYKNGVWTASTAGSTTTAGNNDIVLTIPPGRALLRAWFTQGNSQRLNCNISSDFMNHANLRHDPEMLRHILGRGNYGLLIQT